MIYIIIRWHSWGIWDDDYHNDSDGNQDDGVIMVITIIAMINVNLMAQEWRSWGRWDDDYHDSDDDDRDERPYVHLMAQKMA